MIAAATCARRARRECVSCPPDSRAQRSRLPAPSSGATARSARWSSSQAVPSPRSDEAIVTLSLPCAAALSPGASLRYHLRMPDDVEAQLGELLRQGAL